MLNFDVRNFNDTRREQLAATVRVQKDFNLPTLSNWNYALCRQHRFGWVEDYFDEASQTDKQRTVTDRPRPGCRKCGIHFRQHQRVSIAWLYLKKRALLADTMGSGKTTSAGGLLSLLKETGELGVGRDAVGRAIIVPRAPALLQWNEELHRMMPSLNIAVAEGTKTQRSRQYMQDWEVLLIGPEMLRNDHEFLSRFPTSLLLTDDIDALRNRENATSYVLKRVGREADRMVIMTGTPLQKKLPELYSVLEPIGGKELFGSLKAFERRYIKKDTISDINPRTGLSQGTKQVLAYKNLAEVKQKIAPLVLRRTAADLDDVTLPTIIPEDVSLDLYPAQRAKYTELQRGVVTLLREEGALTKHVTAMSKLTYGAQICGGLAALGEPDGPGTSVKMDWIMDQITPGGDLGAEKVVIFVQYKNNVRALQDRFRAAGIGYETVWGEQPDKVERRRAQDRFWDDPKCRVLLGTQAIEQSLNLQVSRHLINMDMILNPARMEQLAGRIRRDGSAYKHVFVHNLLTINTQEARYLDLLEREAALSSHIWDESSELFQALNPIAMLQLISG